MRRTLNESCRACQPSESGDKSAHFLSAGERAQTSRRVNKLARLIEAAARLRGGAQILSVCRAGPSFCSACLPACLHFLLFLLFRRLSAAPRRLPPPTRSFCSCNSNSAQLTAGHFRRLRSLVSPRGSAKNQLATAAGQVIKSPARLGRGTTSHFRPALERRPPEVAPLGRAKQE